MRKLFFLLVVIASLATLGLTQTHRQTSASAIAKSAKAHEPDLPLVALPTEPGLYAVVYTSMGNIVCRLFEKEAPKTVANFRGLATGTKAWTDPKTGRLKHTPLYSGTTFHRVIPGFMIQGGDPAGDGTGSPGYKFDNEIAPNLQFDRPGLLAMANSGPNTNGCQFFITVAPAEHLNGNYSIFGEVVSGQEVADAISKVSRNAEDRPDTPVKIAAITIRRVEATSAAKPNS
ncbi:MAG: peptidylprolyl isomerase [Acidobacteriaceae bacterium]|nr:peptidylprolyl isomerase [Acidobacteriaceae bacterium]MBV9309144.1 peptidylprolyl isomerase [Acidobacteriaceae bacterium]MBV9937867.1 peptidylprolyl isomerase [Acidobacteriaceae bacterium]